MKINPVIKWSGSKSRIAHKIVRFIPNHDMYYEPFLGGGSVLYALNPQKGKASDINESLIKLWKMIQLNPEYLSDYYEKSWRRMDIEGHEVYYEIRDKYNKDKLPEDLMFLSRTCVNGLIRFNQKVNLITHFIILVRE